MQDAKQPSQRQDNGNLGKANQEPHYSADGGDGISTRPREPGDNEHDPYHLGRQTDGKSLEMLLHYLLPNQSTLDRRFGNTVGRLS